MQELLVIGEQRGKDVLYIRTLILRALRGK
jgi:hypothetical protein